MGSDKPTSDLERVAAEQLAAALDAVGVGSPLPIDSSSDICFTLELLIPEILRRSHPEWRDESIDGFYFSSVTKTGEASAELVGTCILITDQTVTPFRLDLALSESNALCAVRVRLGEPGAGALGISGPKSTSRAAQNLLSTLNDRLATVSWTYDTEASV